MSTGDPVRLNESSEIQRLRDLRRGDRGTILDSLESQYVASGIRSTGALQSNLQTRREYIAANELGPIVDVRINEVPHDFDFRPQDENDAKAAEFAEALSEWAADSTSGLSGMDLFSAFPEIADDQEADGAAVLTMGRRDGAVWYEVRDVDGFGYRSEPKNPRVMQSAVFEWWEEAGRDSKGDAIRAHYLEEITSSGRTLTVDGKPIDEETQSWPDLGMVPVVIIPRRIVKGSLLGDSGVAELETSQNNLLIALHHLHKANKFCAAPVLCPEPSTDDGSLLPDQDGGGTAPVYRYSPGMLYPIPIRAVAGPISVTLIEEVNHALKSLRRLGKVRESGEGEADARSGKAMLIGSEAMRAYVARKLVLLKRGLKQVATLWGLLSGSLQPGEVAPVFAEFATTKDDDTAELTKLGEFWLKACVAGKLTVPQLFSQLKRSGLLDEDADADAMAEEVETQNEEAEAGSMAQAVRMLQQQPVQPQPPANGGGEPQVPEVATEVETDG